MKNFKIDMILNQMAGRVPRNAIGYVMDLQSEYISADVMYDRLVRLGRYVPELVKKYVAEGKKSIIVELAAEGLHEADDFDSEIVHG